MVDAFAEGPPDVRVEVDNLCAAADMLDVGTRDLEDALLAHEGNWDAALQVCFPASPSACLGPQRPSVLACNALNDGMHAAPFTLACNSTCTCFHGDRAPSLASVRMSAWGGSIIIVTRAG